MLNVLIAIVSDSYDTAMATASQKYYMNRLTQVRAAEFHTQGPSTGRAPAEILNLSTTSQVTTGYLASLAYPSLGRKLKREAVKKAVDAVFEESESQVGRILEITERVNEKLQQEMNETKNKLNEMENKLNEMEKKLDRILNAIEPNREPNRGLGCV